ncbi:universal stress protein [Geomonas nitrogeniifigens]|uniref:Universal stress protein n=1 Tax=Geomonas diazotrophica TaxID=2843197 RepID=A0ABX8JP31_9BACT|nr:universal stress protein [Geomonas nitrogeniifigens]QWV98367.1 universal stress protein [Geomonas nitrogeniifigens]QXE87549.1 universal stress protein [Geomonas nitrogeniifigens]
MFKHILVPMDGSKLAEAALPAARFMAEKLGAQVTLFHVVEKDAPSQVHGQKHLTGFEEAQRYLQEVARQWFDGIPRVECHVHETETQLVSQSIVAHAAELGHDLVVMCSHGRGKAIHLLFGSIAQKVIAGGTLPVLITHPDERGEPPPFCCCQILLPLDTDPEHEKGLPVVKAVARICNADLHITTVIPTYESLPPDEKVTARTLPATASRILDLEARDASEHLDGVVQELVREGIRASAHVLRGDPAETIARAAQEAKIDLMVLPTHGKTGMAAFWTGSVAHGICSRSRCPLLLVPISEPSPVD